MTHPRDIGGGGGLITHSEVTRGTKETTKESLSYDPTRCSAIALCGLERGSIAF